MSKDEEPKSPIKRQGTLARQGSIDKKGGVGDDDEEEAEEAVSPSRIKDKREMDKILLTAETKKIKEKLLDMVDDLVVRQNKITPNMNLETFASETSARRVLK